MEGCRRIERDRRTAKLWNHHHRDFAWVSPGASRWRARLGEFATAVVRGLANSLRRVGITDYDEFKARYGSRWAYRLREGVILASDEAWQEFLVLISQHANTKGLLPPNTLQN